MVQTQSKICEILKDTNYKLTQFKLDQIKQMEDSIFQKDIRGKQTNFVRCLVRDKDIQAKPEEIVRTAIFAMASYTI